MNENRTIFILIGNQLTDGPPVTTALTAASLLAALFQKTLFFWLVRVLLVDIPMADSKWEAGTECIGKYNFPGSAAHVSNDYLEV